MADPAPISVSRLDPSVSLPAHQTAGSAGFDLAASRDVTIPPGQIALVPTGLVIAVPTGHFLGIFARSSTPLKRGLVVANGVGVVDSDYCGPADEVKIQVLNVTGAPVTVSRGDRIAQGVIIPFVRVTFVEREAEPALPSRGGFGSTGS
ncbi:MAG: dUTP diphosphatase [Vicinamibacterales bacterium]